MDNEILVIVRSWMKKAENDLKNVRIILESKEEDKPYDTVCFHCQQAAEKFIKAYLTLLDLPFPNTHNIGQLIENALVKDSAMTAFLKADALTTYGVVIRYPDDYYMPTEKETREAYEIALAIQKYVRQKIAELL